MQLEQTLELAILLPPTAQVLGLHEDTTMSYLDYLLHRTLLLRKVI